MEDLALPSVAKAARPGPNLKALLVIAAALYLLPSILVTWGAWTQGAGAVALCGCGDPALFIWFFGWPAHALAHFQNPFFSHAVMLPRGVNLLNATSVEAFSLPLAPVTWIWGPLASLNVALTAMPLLAAITATACISRFLRNRWLAIPAAGLFAFSPYVIGSLAQAHLMTAGVFLLPLLIMGIDELVRTQTHRPIRAGIALGAVLSLELFISSEMFFLYSLGLLIAGLVFLLAVKSGARRHLLHGLIAAGASAGVLCALPLYFAMLGPEHLVGAAWGLTQGYGYHWPMLLNGPRSGLGAPSGTWTGVLSPSIANLVYLGPVAVIASFISVLLARSWVAVSFVLLGILSFLLGLAGTEPLGLWHLLYKQALFSSVIQERFAIVSLFCAVVLIALLADYLLEFTAKGPRWFGVLGILAALGVVLSASGPVWSAAHDIPLTMVPVQEPAWFKANGSQATGRNFLPMPSAYSPTQDALTWQTLDHFAWSQPGFEGPQTLPFRAGQYASAVRIIGRLSYHFQGSTPLPTAKNVQSVRAALHYWKISDVVIPTDIPGEAKHRVTTPNFTAAFFTVVFGRRPALEHRALVWHLQGKQGSGKALHGALGSFQRCWMAPHNLAATYEVTRCVMDWTPISGGGNAPNKP